MIEQFIQEHLIWITPAVSIVLSVLVSILSKNSKLSLRDFLDFGFGLSITSIIIIITNISVNPNIGTWILVIFFMVLMAIMAVVNRLGWKKDGSDIGKEKIRLVGLIIPDIVGISMLIISSIYVGGGIK